MITFYTLHESGIKTIVKMDQIDRIRTNGPKWFKIDQSELMLIWFNRNVIIINVNVIINVNNNRC